jgi:putative transposase
VLTLMIDRATRVVLGMLLSLEAPSRLSVGLCLHHGVFPKQAWLNGLGLPEGCWPGFGLIGTLYTDNGGEFHAQSLRRSAQIYGIELAYRPPKDPAAGGIIERALGTFLRKIRLIPGTSYSRWLGEKPRRAERAGCFTLQELELYLARQVSVYHKTRHRTLGMPPVTAWERAWVVNGARCLPQIPDSSDLFLLTFLPGAWRTITREGVALFGLRYQSPELLPLVQKDVRRVVRFDPRNLSRVFVETESAHVPVDLADHHGAPFSWWEWCERKAWRRSEGRPRDPQTIAAELRANRALITERAGERGRWRAARRQAREAAWRDTTSTASHATWILKSALMPDPSRCRVEE